jgi:hypothetical protein
VGDSFDHFFVVFFFMGKSAMLAGLDPVWQNHEIAAALVIKEIKRTIAEQAVEFLGIDPFVAGEIRAAFVGKKPVAHFRSSFSVFKSFAGTLFAPVKGCRLKAPWRQAFLRHTKIDLFGTL